MVVLGSLLSSLSQRMVRLGTTALMVSGAGLAGYSYYLDQYAAADPRAGTALAWVKAHAMLFIVLGVAGMVLGFILNAVMARRMAKRMMGGMGMPGMGMAGMPGVAGMPGLSGAPMPLAHAAAPPAEVVKVRCRSCSSLQAETAAFCAACGKPMA